MTEFQKLLNDEALYGVCYFKLQKGEITRIDPLTLKIEGKEDITPTIEEIENKASEDETWEDGYKGFVNGAKWALGFIKR